MSRRRYQAIFVLFMMTAPAFGIQNRIIKDDLGFEFTLTTPPQNIISLAPNITEILFALDLGERIAGVTRYCDFPLEALNKPKIGGLIDPSIEKIKSLHPDLIIGFRGNPIRLLKRLKSLNLPVFVLEMGTDLESVFLIINKIGVVTQREKEAQDLVQSLKEKQDKIQIALRNISQEPKVFFSLHGMGLWTCGKGSFIDDLVKKAKGVNIAGKIPRKWLLFNREQLIHEDPEVIIIISKSQEEFLKAKKWINTETYLEGIKAVQSDSIFYLDENLATRPGPRIIEALFQMARILHPRCFVSE